MQLRRIAQYLGLPDTAPVQTSAQTPEAALQHAQAAGIPVLRGRPDDPLLDLAGY